MFPVVTVGFMSTALSGTEGDRVSVCVQVENGAVQLPTLVNVGLNIADITATSKFMFTNLNVTVITAGVFRNV